MAKNSRIFTNAAYYALSRAKELFSPTAH